MNFMSHKKKFLSKKLLMNIQLNFWHFKRPCMKEDEEEFGEKVSINFWVITIPVNNIRMPTSNWKIIAMLFKSFYTIKFPWTNRKCLKF